MDIYDEVEEDFEKKAQKPEPKKADPEPEPEKEAPPGKDAETVARVRSEIHRMWNPEPEETR